MLLKELRKRAQELGIPGRSKMSKKELEIAIESQMTGNTVEGFSLYLGSLSKGEARKARKQQRAQGRLHFAAAPRIRCVG